MQKTGRNEPCPCGSGKKYKKCCLQNARGPLFEEEDTRIRPADGLAMAMGQLIAEHKDEVNRELPAEIDRLSTRLSNPGPRVLSARAAVEALEDHLVEIEAEMVNVLSRRSKYGWIHLNRRIPAFKVWDESDWSRDLGLQVLNLAIVKYGANSRDAEVFRAEFDVSNRHETVLQSLQWDDVRSVLLLRHLAQYHNMIAGSLRRAWKGGDLIIEEDDWRVENSEEQERLIGSLDDRVLRYNTFLSHLGSVADIDLGTADERSNTVLCVVRNYTRDRSFFYRTGKERPALRFVDEPITNFMFTRAQFDQVFRTLRLLGDAFEKRLGVSVEKLEAFIWALCDDRFAECLKSIPKRHQLLNVGYFTIRGDELVGTLNQLALPYYLACNQRYALPVSEAEAKADVRTIMTALSYQPDESSTIDLWDRTPARLFLPLPDGFLCDLQAVPLALQHLAGEFSSLSGDVGSRKGENFEIEVMSLASSRGMSLWDCRKVLRASAGEGGREIDVSVIQGDTLFVLECKATGMNPLTLRGEIVRLRERWEETVEHCDQAESLAEYLRSKPQGDNYSVPAAVRRIEWAVVAPCAEWIPTADARYWFTETVPRVCAPEECLDFIQTWH